MLFMKGSPDAPKCGFSRQIVEILTANNIPFASFDILTNEIIRAGLKTYSDWPTFPQLFVTGEFVGGLDIIKEIASGGDLKTQLGEENLSIFYVDLLIILLANNYYLRSYIRSFFHSLYFVLFYLLVLPVSGPLDKKHIFSSFGPSPELARSFKIFFFDNFDHNIRLPIGVTFLIPSF